MRAALLGLAGLASSVLAAANCTSRTVQLNINSTNIVSNFSASPTDQDLVRFVQQAIALNGANNVSASYVQGNQSLAQNVSIATSLCVPSNYSCVALRRPR